MIVELTENEVTIYEESLKLLILEVYLHSFDVDNNNLNDEVNSKYSQLKELVKEKKARVFGHIYNDKLIGILWFYERNHFGVKRYHINFISTDSNYKNKGIAKELIEELEKEAIRNNISQIDLFVSENNHPAKNMYEKLNFNTERRQMVKDVF